MPIVNLCFCDYASMNVAENFTQPGDYFDFGVPVEKRPLLQTDASDIGDDVSMVIVGGGGFVRGRSLNAFARICDVVRRVPRAVPIVVWGMGMNDHGRFDRQIYHSLSALDGRSNVLVGVRDAGQATYVPCVSCLRPEFDQTYEVEHDVVVYEHHAFPLDLPYPKLSNRLQGDPVACFCGVIRFLGSATVVVTNTYHGVYWATLLGRKVVVAQPFSNKFLGFKHEPVIVQSVELVARALAGGTSYPDALTECREANRRFFERVRTFGRRSA